MKLAILFALSALGLCVVAGCAGVPTDAPVLRASQPTNVEPGLFNGPFWVYFESGDEIPVELNASSTLFELQAADNAVIRVKRPFYLLLNDGFPRFSYDRVELLDGDGSFQFGLSATKDEGTKAIVSVRHAVPEE